MSSDRLVVQIDSAATGVHLAIMRRYSFTVRTVCCGALLAVAILGVLPGCSQNITNPLVELQSPQITTNRQMTAMSMLDDDPTNESYINTLHQIIWRPGYTQRVREAALLRLEQHDPDGLQRTLRQRVPNMNTWAWLERCCEIIAERGWVQQTPTLVSSWSRPTMDVTIDTQRPEYLALVQLHGKDRVTDVVFETFMQSNKVSQQGLRTRCWNLLHRLGERQRLIALLEDVDASPEDLMLNDLRAGAREFGIVPRNREEILWLRKIRQPEHEAFWSQAVESMQHVSVERKSELGLRDLAIVVAAYRHQPELLSASEAELYRAIEKRTRGQRMYSHSSNFDGNASGRADKLYGWKNELTWSDLAAMTLLLQALQVPELRAHLFDFAERDIADESTEYGGVLNLDEQGRFQFMEFIPRVRQHDQKFLASQAMFDAGYTALFHVHFHCQRWGNKQWAGPGFGDTNYADNTRANCVVLTCIDDDRLNIDFYRHDRVTIDLGIAHRP